MNKMIGIVGKIGSGKSSVRNLLADLGASVLDADDVNRELRQDPTYIAKVGLLCPNAVKEGVIDPAVLREWAFGDPANLQSLNRATHPLIRDRILEIARDYPLLFVEVSAYREGFLPFDEVWVVDADAQIRLSRVAFRNPGWTIEDAKRAMAAQEDMRFPKDAVLILNNGGRRQLADTVKRLYEERI